MSPSSVISVIRTFAVILSVLSSARAQVVPLGVSMVPNPMLSENSSPPPPSPSNTDPAFTNLSPPSPSNTDSGSGAPPPSMPYSSYSDSNMYSPPMETGSPAYGAPPSQYTPPPAQPSDPYQMMPYSSFTGGGYSQMDCGYGYKKGSDGKCYPESWVCTSLSSCSRRHVRRTSAVESYVD